MTEVLTGNDCGNSPKCRLLKDLTIALARADHPRVARLVTHDVCWQPAGRKPVVGAAAFCSALTRYGPAKLLQIDHVVAHGRAGAVDGVIRLGAKLRSFCFVFEFVSAAGKRVKCLKSWSVALGAGRG